MDAGCVWVASARDALSTRWVSRDVLYKGVGAPEAPVPISGKSALLFSWRTIVADA